MLLEFHLPLLARFSTPAEGWAWCIIGLSGNAIFGSRFFIQWIHAEKHQESKVPEIFWWISVLGTFVLLAYFLHIRNIVGMLGNGPNLIPYTRNLMLIYKKRKTDPRALEALDRETPEQRALAAATHPDA